MIMILYLFMQLDLEIYKIFFWNIIYYALVYASNFFIAKKLHNQ